MKKINLLILIFFSIVAIVCFFAYRDEFGNAMYIYATGFFISSAMVGLTILLDKIIRILEKIQKENEPKK